MAAADLNLRVTREAVLHIEDGVRHVRERHEGGKAARRSHEQVGNLQQRELVPEPHARGARNEYISATEQTMLPFLKSADHDEQPLRPPLPDEIDESVPRR